MNPSSRGSLSHRGFLSKFFLCQFYEEVHEAPEACPEAERFTQETFPTRLLDHWGSQWTREMFDLVEIVVAI